jgi:hypothetical protein
VRDWKALVGLNLLLGLLGFRLAIEELEVHLLRLIGFIQYAIDANYAGSSP